MNSAIVVRAVDHVDSDELLALYSSVGWEAYTADPAGLAAAVANSTLVVEARAAGQLIGLARGISDNVSIFYLQDILVRPEWQRHGIGRKLLGICLNRFAHVRQKVLLTDDAPAQHQFYEAMGYTDVARTNNPSVHAFVKIEGLEIEGNRPAD